MSKPEAETLATLATIREAIEAESVSYGQLADLQSLADQPEVRSWIIANGEIDLAQWADIPEAEFLGETRLAFCDRHNTYGICFPHVDDDIGRVWI